MPAAGTRVWQAAVLSEERGFSAPGLEKVLYPDGGEDGTIYCTRLTMVTVESIPFARMEDQLMTRRALITGITGQDGSYLAEFLLEKGYQVHGTFRRRSSSGLERIEHLLDRLVLHEADLLDPSSLIRALEQSQADEVYNLAAQSFIPTSFCQPVLTGEFTGLGVTRLLEAIRQVNPRIRFYQASSSEMFGKVREEPQSEATPFWPAAPTRPPRLTGTRSR